MGYKKVQQMVRLIQFLGVLWVGSVLAFNGEQPVGAGSYSTVLPPGVGDVQTTIYKTSNLTKKMETNDWWSSTAWMQYSERQYPHPLAVQNQPNGLRVYYPGPSITGNSACVCGWMPAGSDANANDDLILGHSATSGFSDTRVDDFNDWFVTNVSRSGSASLKVTYGHGSPYIFAEYGGGSPKVMFATAPMIWSGNAASSVLGVTVNNRHYALFGPSGSTWSGVGSATLINSNNAGKNYFSLALLPDNTSATLQKFQQYAYAFVSNTQVTWNYNAASAELSTNYQYTTTAKEGTQTGTIFALYPHQWKNSQKSLLPYTYTSVRGQMKVAEGSLFTTKMKFHGVLPSLPDRGTYNRSTLATYIDQAEAETYNGPQDTYWYGKYLGKLATLAPIAEQVGDTIAANAFRNTMKNGLQNWLKASDSAGNIQSSQVFYYNNNWGTLFGYPDSYGSVQELNDHHFHYGYFIKAAAEIARVDKNWASDNQWGGMIKLLTRDIANADRNDTQFPFLRNFDIYAGHTWASGHARFGDGNNNESSSEAMNAWAGMILFAMATNNTAMRDLGIYLYTTELNAINEYWFDVTGQNHHPNFTRSTASMIWGGKTVGDGVWWTANPEEVHGINWLPIHGGSLYLTQYPNYTRYNYDTLVSENNGTNWDVWSDLIWMYRAIHNPEDAIAQMNARIGSLQPEAGNSKANTYHWIHNLNALGTTDLAVTANHPLYAVFTKAGQRTYVAYNPSASAITVTFSDGTQISVPPNSFNTGNGGPSDTQPPTVPTGLTSPSQTASTVALSWTAASDNVGVAGYKVFRNGSFVANANSTSFTVTGLSANTTYGFSVSAYDAAGNESAQSASLSVKTSANNNNYGHQINGNSVQFYVNNAPWADVHYVVNNGAQQNIRMTHLTGNNSYAVNNMANGSTVKYFFTIGLAAGGANDTAWVSFTMNGSGGDTIPPSAPSGLNSPAQTSASVDLQWQASTDNVGVTGYHVYRGGIKVGTVTNTQFTDTGLSASTTYQYTVKAVDAAANESAASNSVSVTTAAGSSGYGHTINGTSVMFFVNNAPWADIHYTINNGAQQNFRMIRSGSNNTFSLSNVPSGAVVRYQFTIGRATGGAFDTAWMSFTK